MLTKASVRRRAIFATLAFSGLRGSELRALRWSDIHLAAGTISVRQRAGAWGDIGERGKSAAASSDWALWFSSMPWLSDVPQLGYIPPAGPKWLVAGTDLIDITAANSDVFNLNHDIYANSPAVIGDLKRLLKDGQRPPDARTGELVKVPAAGGEYWAL